ncbi:MAG: hypothetical protein F4Y24_01775 [Gemmatimonadetes bacterium]|nr:hypothetical protein [Gemmatimonadota bacterium]MYG24144.1 hypothetical protein [Gemmatimonadota bacterium]MYJ40675.1 hypothetical protein [Gemmatimonadota bacterium]
MNTPSSSTALHRRVAVDTPEHVRLDYVLADLGSRVGALAIDLAIMVGTSLLLGLALYYAGALGDMMQSVSATILIFAVFLAQWGYFMLFEGLGGGRTPGKRAIGLRVVHVGGEPLSFRGSVLRNLIRAVDFLPVVSGIPSGLVGAVCMLVNRRAQRLGDLVAGTMVVRDAGGSELLGGDELPPARAGRPLLSVEQFELLAGYVARREKLAPEIQRRVAASVVKALAFALARDAADAATRTADENLVRLHEQEAPRHAARRGSASLQAATMARERREEWAAYVDLVERGRKRGLKSLSEHEVQAFGQLYRGVTADLARARTYGASPGLLGTVQRWAGAGHNLLYRARGRVAVSLGHWVAAEFPRAVRLYVRPIALATVLFYGSGIVAYIAVRDDPLLGRTLSPGLTVRAENTEKGNINARYLEEDVEGSDMPVLASALMTNNVAVTFSAFAGGLLAGAGTLYILLLNGIGLGAGFGVYANEGVLLVLLAWVSSHGVIELTAICIAGGAGFGLGSALLMPGRRTRAEALMERGRAFLSLIAGTAIMLVAAGLIEGFYSPLQLHAGWKFAFGGMTAVLLVLYFGFAGRRRPTEGSAA